MSRLRSSFAYMAVLGSSLVLSACGARTPMLIGGEDGGADAMADAGSDSYPDVGPDVKYDVMPDNTTGCGPTNCGGCCDTSGSCVPGLAPNACGIGGYACVDCAQFGSSCNAGTHQCGAPPACNASTCPNGCCDVNGHCQPGNSDSACGTAGAACAQCNLQQHCLDGKQCVEQPPTCNAANCKGCCDGTECRQGTASNQCGTHGEVCFACPPGSKCDPNGLGVCTTDPTNCGPWNCKGCCAGNTCLGGNSDPQCGTQGEVCHQCPAGSSCQPDGSCEGPQPTCGPDNCKGCCEGDKCLPGYDQNFCGFGGQKCSSCPDGTSCNPQPGGGPQCEGPGPHCGPDNCKGCCDFATYPPMCRQGNQIAACGSYGKSCDQCSKSEQCMPTPNGTYACVQGPPPPHCGPDNCKGCCDNSTLPASCRSGHNQWSCGSHGVSCDKCSSFEKCIPTPGTGYSCVQGPPPPDGGTGCGPWNCKGCCTPYGQCRPGASDYRCGSGGEMCQNCGQQGETCDHGTCTSSSNCPAPYPGCNSNKVVPKPNPSPGACSDGVLSYLRKSCQGPTSTQSCDQAFQIVAQKQPACMTCLLPFMNDQGTQRCIEPYLNDKCKHLVACVTECLDTACSQCDPSDQQSCQNSALWGGTCQNYAYGAYCYQTAIKKDAPFCEWHDNLGDWLASVGGHYCQ